MYHRFYGYTVAPDPDGNRWTAVKDGAITLYAPTEQEVHDTIRAVIVDDYMSMRHVIIHMLKDYLHMVETSDRPDGVRIMKDVNQILDRLQRSV